MNCCDYDCTQGRNCPARVAKVGRRTPKHGQDYTSSNTTSRVTWRVYLKDLARAMLFSLVSVLIGLLATFCFVMGITR